MISAIILAAGEATRFGMPKQLALFEGKPLLERTLEQLRASRAGEIVVVLGAHAGEIRRQIRFDRERVVINPQFADGMSTSIRAGLRAVNGDAALIVLADQPFVRPETIDRLIAEYERSRPKVVVPAFEGRRGNPVLIDRAYFADMMTLRGDVGFRALFAERAESIVTVAVDDRGVLTDIDTPADLSRSSHVA